MNTVEQFIAYARAHPKNATGKGKSWHLWCEAFMYRAGGFTRSFGTATLAGDASGWLNPNAAAAPRGAFHYWGTGQGHVGLELGGGQILMASDGVTTSWGIALGVATLAEYSRNKPGPTYRGWSLRHGTQVLAQSAAAAASNVEQITIRKRKKNKMHLVWDTNGTGYLVTEDGMMGLASPQVYKLFERVINSDQTKSPFNNTGAPDTFFKAELDIMAANLRLLTASANAQVAIDPVKLASALKDALGKTLSVTADIDPAALATAFAEAVPRIVKAVNDDAAKRLAS